MKKDTAGNGCCAPPFSLRHLDRARPFGKIREKTPPRFPFSAAVCKENGFEEKKEFVKMKIRWRCDSGS